MDGVTDVQTHRRINRHSGGDKRNNSVVDVVVRSVAHLHEVSVSSSIHTRRSVHTLNMKNISHSYQNETFDYFFTLIYF